MYITVANMKGGVAKTTTAVHLATFLQKRGSTLLLDSDPNRSASGWARHGKLPFTVLSIEEGLIRARDFEHVIIDTQARPEGKDLASLARGCNLLVLPTAPAGMDVQALFLTLTSLKSLGAENYRVLLTIVPPPPETDAAELRNTLMRSKVPVFKAEIPRLKAFRSAFDQGVPVYDVDDRRSDRAWSAYEAVGEEVLA